MIGRTVACAAALAGCGLGYNVAETRGTDRYWGGLAAVHRGVGRDQRDATGEGFVEGLSGTERFAAGMRLSYVIGTSYRGAGLMPMVHVNALPSLRFHAGVGIMFNDHYRTESEAGNLDVTRAWRAVAGTRFGIAAYKNTGLAGAIEVGYLTGDVAFDRTVDALGVSAALIAVLR